ncbi:hypothetical protein NOR53_3205 [gamma proteobacterium NOR5-3]|nr:hypothetical protein NOR53_3205 [gamma proteobacterium NOR5-3]
MMEQPVYCISQSGKHKLVITRGQIGVACTPVTSWKPK